MLPARRRSSLVPLEEASAHGPALPARPGWMARPTLVDAGAEAAANVAVAPAAAAGDGRAASVDDGAGWEDDLGEAKPYATRSQVREWAKPRNTRRESGYGGSPDLDAAEDGRSSGGATRCKQSFLPTVAVRRPVLLDTPVKIGRAAAPAAPAALTKVLESVSSRMELSGDWESAAALSTSASVIAEVQDALNAAHVKSNEVTAPELLTALLSCFAQ